MLVLGFGRMGGERPFTRGAGCKPEGAHKEEEGRVRLRKCCKQDPSQRRVGNEPGELG